MIQGLAAYLLLIVRLKNLKELHLLLIEKGNFNKYLNLKSGNHKQIQRAKRMGYIVLRA